MKRKKSPTRPRNTLVKRLRNCSTFEERWFLLRTGSPHPTKLEHLVDFVLIAKDTERKRCASGSNLTDNQRKSFDQWRANLEHWAGKELFSIVMEGDAKALRVLAETVERMEAVNAEHPSEIDPLRVALLKLFRHRVAPWRTTWRELEAKLAEPELHAGGHDRNHIRRVMKQLGIWKLVQIPAKRKPKP